MAAGDRSRNGLLSASGYGDRRVAIIRVGYGITIDGSTDTARNYEAFYPKRVTQEGFVVTVVLAYHERAQEFAEWMEHYAHGLAEPGSAIGPMRVLVPAMGFDLTGVPTSGVVFGDKIGKWLFPMDLSFAGVADASEFHNPVVSRFKSATSNDRASRYFYPAGTQQSGNQGLDPLTRDPLGVIVPPDPAGGPGDGTNQGGNNSDIPGRN